MSNIVKHNMYIHIIYKHIHTYIYIILYNVTCHTFPKVCGTSSSPNSKSPMSNVHQCSSMFTVPLHHTRRAISPDPPGPKESKATIHHYLSLFRILQTESVSFSLHYFIHFIDFETSRASGKPHLLREVWLCRGLCRASNKSTWP